MIKKNSLSKSKNANISEKERRNGNDLFNQRKYKEALKHFYSSLQQAPHDSYEYIMALSERSKVHFVLKNHKVDTFVKKIYINLVYFKN